MWANYPKAVKVTYDGGYATIPQDLKTATSTDLSTYRLCNGYRHNPSDHLPFARGGIDTRNLDKYRNKN